MNLTIRKTNLPWSPALARHVRDRVERRLGRIGDAVRTVVVRIGDVNGPRGGRDKHCRVTVRLATGRDVVVNALHACPYRAVDEAASRLTRAVKRTIDRTRSRRRRGGSS